MGLGSGGAEQLRVANKWSAGLKPTVFHETLQVNSETVSEGVGEGTGGDGKAQVDEDEHRLAKTGGICFRS